MKLIIKELEALVEIIIVQIMNNFKTLGKKAKKMASENNDPKEIENIYLKMAQIFYDLKSFEEKVRTMYPKMNKLFDDLLSLREGKLKISNGRRN